MFVTRRRTSCDAEHLASEGVANSLIRETRQIREARWRKRGEVGEGRGGETGRESKLRKRVERRRRFKESNYPGSSFISVGRPVRREGGRDGLFS